MNVRKSDWIVLAALAVALWGGNLSKYVTIGGGGGKTPAPSVPAPSAELQAVVRPVAALVVGEKAAADRAELAALALALAEFHGRDRAALIKTTALLADHNAAALQAFYQATGMTGRYAGLGAAVDKALGGWIGAAAPDGTFKSAALDAAAAAKIAEFYRGAAWAFSESASNR